MILFSRQGVFMEKAIIYIVIAIFLALVIQPNISNKKIENPRVPSQTENAIMTNDTVDLTTCESKSIICIDPAFGGYDYGYAEDGKEYGKDVTLQLSKKIGEYLEQAGYTVVYTRTSDDIPTFYNDNDSANYRINSAKNQGATYLISVKVTSDVDFLSRGYTIFTQPDEQLIELASSISTQLQSINYSQYKGSDSDHYGNFPILNDSSLPTLFVEFGYMSNIQDYSQLTNAEMQDKIGSAIVKSFLAVIN